MADFLFGLDYYGDPNKKQTLADLIGSGAAFNRQQATDFANAFKFNNIDQLVGATGQQALQYARQASPFVSTRNQADGFLGGQSGQTQNGQLPIRNFQLPQTATYSSDMFSNLRGFSDIQNLLQQNTEQTNRLAGLQTPSTEEQAFQQQLINLRAEADKLRLGTEAGRQAIDQKIIPRQVQVGQKQALAEQAQLESNTLAARESNLLQSLGLAQEARQSQINAESIKQQGTQFGIGVAQNLLNTDINLRTKVAEQLRQAQQDFFARTDKLTEQAQTRLATILDLFKGSTVDQLDEATQLQLQALATQAGIPFGTISQGLKTVKDQLDFQRLTQERALNQPQVIGQDEFGSNIYGRYNSVTNNFEPINISGTGVVTIPESSRLAYVNNNPGNLKFVGQVGATQGEGGFAKFITPEAGYNALIADIQFKQSGKSSNTIPDGPNAGKRLTGDSTLEDMIRVYAPTADKNDPVGYAAFVAQNLNISVNTKIKDIDTVNLAKYVAQEESGATIKSVNADVGNKSAEEIAQSIFSGTSSLRVSDLPTKLRPAVDKELGRLRQEALTSGDLEGVMRASAGGKDVTDSFLQSFSKGVNVLGQIGELKSAINNEAVGPITGLIRSNNPYDVKAQEIKARLTAIVPNLARGIYGEVGVLTDNDIKTYSRTLPNLSSTEEISNALLGITLRSVQRSLENQIKSQAAGGRDMSGFINIYQDIKKQADNLLGTGSAENLNLNLNQSFASWKDLLGSLNTELQGRVKSIASRMLLDNPNLTEQDLLAIFSQ